ncbi:MAG: glycerol-3-phosphate dehydrogenase [Candidatus Aegiribacteria sp.]|nr:glycerol-3-phosphate dehydrogenase [Candidatus Aegiribacteria sp.]
MPLIQAVLGCGRWGSFHLWYGSRVGNTVTGWEPEGIPGFIRLQETRKNRYLELPPDIRLTSDIEEVSGSDMIIVTVPAQKFRSLCGQLRQIDISATDLILCMKGIEKDTGKRLTEISQAEGLKPRSLSIWVGPGHPQQFVAGVPSCMIIASENENDSVRIARLLSSDLIRFYWSRDIIGCEVGAAAKNVIGIAAGILDGLNHSGLKGALMARAPQEVARLAAAMGGDWRSVYGLSHLGDYEATLFSPYSNNRLYGEAIGKGTEIESLQLAEGVDTATAVMLLADEYNVEMPITSTVRKIINNEIPATEALGELFARPEKEEFPDHF